jgi:hypothetical protein
MNMQQIMGRMWVSPGSGQQILSRMGDKCLQLGMAFAHKDGSYLAVNCKQKNLCKFKNIFNSSFQILLMTMTILNYSLLFSLPHITISKEKKYHNTHIII